MSNKDHSEFPNGNDLMDIDDDSLEDLAREIEARSAPPKVYRKGYQVKHKVAATETTLLRVSVFMKIKLLR